MAITALPTVPTRTDPANFSARADALLMALPTFVNEINDLQITTNTATAASAAASATSATASAAARDAAIAAWAASTEPAETLAARSQSLHIGAVVKAIVYDTSKDSDGGAWRKRCQDKSWYTETLGGDRWIGQYATIALAWAAAGSTTGAVFQASATAGPITSGKYYAATSSTTATEVFRGITREFPAVAGIVAESARVVIYDLSNGAMWMAFVGGGALWTNFNICPYTAAEKTSIAAINGYLLVGGTSSALGKINFLTDTSYQQTQSYNYGGLYLGNISTRHSGRGFQFAGVGPIATPIIVNAMVNDIAITVLDNAPIDPATGLPVPTIAVATAGGVSEIQNDGTVKNSSSTTSAYGISYDGLNRIRWNTTTEYNCSPVAPRGAAFTASSATEPKLSSAAYSSSNIPITPAITTATGKSAKGAVASSAGLTLHKMGQSANALHAAITNAYNSGWMPGDIRGAYLADTVAETITASGELVTNGTFASDLTGWTNQSTGTGSAVYSAGTALISGTDTSNRGIISQGVTTVVGRQYVVTVALVFTSGQLFVGTGTTNTFPPNVTLGSPTTTRSYSYTFTATQTTTYIYLWTAAGGVATADNISVKLADPDRSVKNNGLIINGSLTKAAVASGAGLVSYAGFSAANYLEQPYNADLDFGTGDFCVMGWVKGVSTLGYASIFSRNEQTATYGKNALWVGVSTSNFLNIATSNGSAVSVVLTAPSALTVFDQWLFITGVRRSGVLELYGNGVLLTSIANTTDLTNVLATSLVGGVKYAGSILATNSISHALCRVSATAPTADQIAHIYRTELPLFQANAQCTIAGTSTAVTALAYDDSTDLLHVGTSWGRTSFNNLVRVESEATAAGALTSLSAQGGAVITGGTSGRVYVPAVLLRDELKRRDEARAALGKVPVFFDFTATSSQTAFVLPKGYTAKALYKQGTLMRETTTGVYWTRSTDGFQETCTLSVGATVSDWISVMATRNY